MSESLDPDCLRAFAAVARTGSFTRAGEILFRSQSAISLQIRKLEDQLGERLFRRSARQVSLTPAGERLNGYASRLLALNEEALAAFRDREISGVVRLGTPEDFATSHLPAALSRFARAYPKVQLEVECELTLAVVERFRAGKLDVALIKREPSATLEGHRVWREPLVWVGRDAEAFSAERESVALVVNPEPCVYRKRAFEALQRSGRRPRAAYVCGSLAGSLAAVRAGLGITVLPRDMAPPDLATDHGELLPFMEDTEIVLVTAADASASARRLADFLEDELEAQAGASQSASDPVPEPQSHRRS